MKARKKLLEYQLSQLYRADFGFGVNSSAHQKVISDIHEFNKNVKNFKLVCPSVSSVEEIATGIIRVINGRGRTGPPRGDLHLVP